MPFRAFNHDAATEFKIQAAPGMALSESFDKIGVAVSGAIDKIKAEDDKKRQRQDALNVLHNFNINNLEGVFKNVQHAGNAALGLDLFKVGAVELERRRREANEQVELDYKTNTLRAYDEAYEKAGPEILRDMLEDITIAPAILKPRQRPVMDKIPRVKPDGTPELDAKGEPLYDSVQKIDEETGQVMMEEVMEEILPEQKAKNLAKPVAQRLLDEYEASGRRPTGQEVRAILGMQKESFELGSKQAREVRLRGGLGQDYDKSSDDTLRQLAVGAQAQAAQRSLAKLNNTSKQNIARSNAIMRWSQVNAEIDAKKSIAEKSNAMKEGLSRIQTAHQEASIYLREYGKQVRYNPDNSIMKDKDTGLPMFVQVPDPQNPGQTMDWVMDRPEIEARLEIAKAQNDEVLVKAANKLMLPTIVDDEKVPGKVPEVAWWNVLSAMDVNGLNAFASRSPNEYGIYIGLIKQLMGGNPHNTAGIPELVKVPAVRDPNTGVITSPAEAIPFAEYLERLAVTTKRKISIEGFRTYLAALQKNLDK